jgi:hypothetical protein
MRANYWSLSKLADSIRKMGGIEKMPSSGTCKEWSEYHKRAKATNKFANWLADDFLDSCQNVWLWVPDKLDSFSYWVYNRFISKEWIIDTKLNKNDWHETDEKILHGLLETVVDFVEVQKASRSAGRKSFSDFLPYFIDRLIPYRSAQAGINHLLWEVSLVNDETMGVFPGTEGYGEPTRQAKSALEVLHLYVWWKYIRPNRPDPYEFSRYNDYYEATKDRDILDFEDRTPEEEAMRVLCYEKLSKIEDEYYAQDTEMLTKVIIMRRDLWT